MTEIIPTSFPEPEKVSCPKCRNSIILFDSKGTEFCVCPSCDSYLTFTKAHSPMVLGQVNKLLEQPLIPLGAEGSLKGHTFKMIAYLEKKEEGKAYTWKEYILYNFEKGYAVLSVYDGHWNFVTGVEFHPELKRLRSQSNKFLTFRKEKYSLYNRYSSETTSLIGEFNWDALKSNIAISEYIAPPFMVFYEKYENNEAEYFLGRYIEPSEIAEAFNLELKLFPSKRGVGANQVSKFAGPMKDLWNITRYLIIALIVIQGLIMIIKPETEAISLSHEVLPSVESSFKTSSFSVYDRSSAIEIEIFSDVYNNWLEATSVLVNEKTNQTWEVTQGVEYYSGYEDGERWSEGSTETSILLSSIPEGTYHLNIYPATGEQLPKILNVKVILNATLWRNLLCTILLICIYPLYTKYRVRSFERQRWNNSDFSPYWE
jgi:hypothetical protein